MRCVLCVVALGACAPSDRAGTDADTGTDADDAPGNVPPAHHYVADRITLAAPQAFFGVDLDGDSAVDNRLGDALVSLAQGGFPQQPTTTAAVDTGKQITLIEVAAADFANAEDARFTALVGSQPMPAACADASDTICRRHLDGHATFSVEPSDTTELRGSIVSGSLVAGPGHATIQITFWGGTPVAITLRGAQARLPTVSASTISDGILGGAISATDMDQVVLPAMRDGLMSFVARDCTDPTTPPTCGCPPDTDGKTVLGVFDVSPRNCVIEVSDLRGHSYVRLDVPDVVIEGTPAFSAAIKLSAVAASFTR